MQSKNVLFVFVSFLFLFSFSSALPSDSDVDLTFNYPINYSTIPTVNNSQYFDGYTPSTLWDLYETYVLALSKWDDYLLLSGGSMTGNINMGGNNITNADKINTNCITLEDGFEYCTLATTYYNATSSEAVSGTISGTLGLTQHSDGNYDGVTLNITEQVSSPALDVRVNFTDGITDFTQGILRYYTSSLSGDNPVIQLWDYEDSKWENYGELSESLSFSTIEQSVFDSSEHVQDGTVQMRLYKSGNGNINNKYYVDWFAIAKGFGVPTGEEIDPIWINNKPYYLRNDENINLTGYNVTADYFFGDGSQLTGISTGGTSLWNESGDYIIPSNNSKAVKIESSSTSLPSITGTLDFAYVDTEGAGYDPADYEGEEQTVKVWGYKDVGVDRIFTSNYLTATLEVDNCPYDYAETQLTDVSGGVTNSIEYDGFMIYFIDTGELTEGYVYANSLYWNDDDALDKPTTTDRPTLTETAGMPFPFQTTGIGGIDGEAVKINGSRTTENAEFEKNVSITGTASITNLIISNLLSASTGTFPTKVVTPKIERSDGKSKITFNSNNIKFQADGNDYFNFYQNLGVYLVDGSAGLTTWVLRTDTGESYLRNGKFTIGTNGIGAGALDFNLLGDEWLYNNNDELVFGPDKIGKIGYNGTNMLMRGNYTFTDDVSIDGNLDIYGTLTEHSYKTNLTDEEAYNLVKNANLYYDNGTGELNYSSWGECYIPEHYSTKTITEINETKYQEDIIYAIKNNLTEPHISDYKYSVGIQIYVPDGTNLFCKQVMLQKAQAYTEKVFNGGTIIAQDYKFKSKAVNSDVDYTSIFSNAVPFTEKHKSKYAENLSLNGVIVPTDDVEQQIKDLQGYVLQHEFCRHNNKKLEDYNSCMDNGETLGEKIK